MVAKGVLIDNGSIKDVQDAMEDKEFSYKLEHNLASLATIAGCSYDWFFRNLSSVYVAFHEMASAGGQIDVEMLSKGI